MLVRNWMHPDPMTVPGDMLVSEAKRLISDNNLHALPVVDGGRLRGLVTRANLLRMGQFVLRTQDPDEFAFFVTRLRVRDVMVRNPATVEVGDTMEHCLRRGQELGVAQFPVMDGERVAGVISANEIFQLAAHCLGVLEQRSSVTLAPLSMGPGVLGHIADVAEGAGAVLQALYPIAGGRQRPEYDAAESGTRVVIRFHAPAGADVVSALEAAGFPVLESADTPRQSVAA